MFFCIDTYGRLRLRPLIVGPTEGGGISGVAVADNIEVKNVATTNSSQGISVITFLFNAPLLYNDPILLCIFMQCDTWLSSNMP
jgi:hypothetical protein